MENEKKWEKPEMTILFSGNVDEHLTVETWSPPTQQDSHPTGFDEGDI